MNTQTTPELDERGDEQKPQPITLSSDIYRATGDDERYPWMGGVYIDAEERQAIATDGRIMAIAPIDGDVPESFSMPRKAAKLARRHSGITYAGGVVTVVGRPPPNSFAATQNPPVEKFQELFQGAADREHAAVICINARLLLQLQRSITTDQAYSGLRLYIGGPEDAVYVESSSSGGGVGLLMPIRI